MTSKTARDDMPSPADTLDALALARLRELDPDGRTGVVPRVMRAFDASLTRALAALAQAAQRGDLAALRHLSHMLKSSSASVGALELSSTCAQLEALARDNRPMDIPVVLARLQANGALAQAAVRALLEP